MLLRSFISRFMATALFVAAGIFTGCSLIDEDISRCNNQVRLTYELRLDPEIVQELEDELDLHSDEQIRTLLKGYVDNVFTNYARDVDLFFYDTEEPMALVRSLSETMNSSSNTYALSMPVRSYMHTAVTNVKYSELVHIFGNDTYTTGRLEHEATGEYYAPQKSGLFSTSRRLDVGEKANQRFRIKLQMVNSMTALILDMGKATEVEKVRVVVQGMATGYNLAEDTYTYDENAVFSTDEFVTEDGIKHCFAAVHFPSHEDTATKSTDIGDDTDDDPSQTGLWKWVVYATLKDGTVTRSELNMRPPVNAGQLKIRNAFVKDNGEVGSNEVDVSVTVQIDWKPGWDIPVPLG